MRLIQTTGTDPEIFFADEQQIPPYAIISHVWEEEEVTFQDMQDPSKRKNMKGWSKIVRACKLARSEDWDYIWFDTCCIDKSSSSELPEAINSIVAFPDPLILASMCAYKGMDITGVDSTKDSRLLCKRLGEIGTKASLREILTEITGIPSDILLSRADPSEMSIAARMSWAAGRQTTRIEDRAYSLVGIFGVFMPTIYGEGEHAFIRLQEEILKVSDDHTIFVWKEKETMSRSSGIVATSPDAFEESGEYKRLDGDPNDQYRFTSPPSSLDQSPPTAVGSSELLPGDIGTSGHLHDAILAECEKVGGSPQELLFKAWNLPPIERNDFRSNRISVSIAGGQGIKPIKQINSAKKITDTARMGAFTLSNREPCVFLFMHDPSHQPFVVVVGRDTWDIWLDLVLDFETDQPDLKDIQESYQLGQKRASVRQENFDMISKFLTDNVAIVIETRRQNRCKVGHPSHIVNIRIDNAVPVALPIRTYQ
ncbi:hypothetical protein BDP27DRAFT_1448743 [Rhodocollybia butyracea]|uniref:Heterokaryon incompatibility domain-containing protein n=1 Tax=Rhodocollybia butyracea TaxID=206335 RepID=A0A9P5PR37_9AGAR|nr:hypothetical protein BDP27DRAFT_1448743 [Rhodocollybia butyracea]